MNVKKLGLAIALLAGLGVSGAAHSNNIVVAGDGGGTPAQTTHTGSVNVEGYYQWTIPDTSVAYSTEAGPWEKVLELPENGGVVVGYKLVETITNNSLIAWTDWHEEVLGGWTLFRLKVTYPPYVTSSVFFPGTVTVDYDFLAPILPGKSIEVETVFTPPPGTTGQTLKVRQYPTVPEPATLALLGLGLAGLSAMRRTRLSA